MIVADAGPIIAFARIGRLALLQQVVGELMVPDAVYEELVVTGAYGEKSPGPYPSTSATTGLWLTTKLVLHRRVCLRHGSASVNASRLHRVSMLSHCRNSLPVPKRRKVGAPLAGYSTSP